MSDYTVAKEIRFQALRTVFHAVSLSLTARAVYFEIDDRTGYKNNHCWPKQETIAAFLGISVRAVRDGLDELIERGFVRVERKSKSINYFPFWCDRQNLPITSSSDRQNTAPDTGRICRYDRQNLPVRGVLSINEPQKEPQKEPRCSICGDSGVSGSTGADVADCVCRTEPRRRLA